MKLSFWGESLWQNVSQILIAVYQKHVDHKFRSCCWNHPEYFAERHNTMMPTSYQMWIGGILDSLCHSLFLCPSIRMSVHLFVRLFVPLSICLSICSAVCVCLFVHASVHLLICTSILSVCLPICLSVDRISGAYRRKYCLFMYLSLDAHTFIMSFLTPIDFSLDWAIVALWWPSEMKQIRYLWLPNFATHLWAFRQ